MTPRTGRASGVAFPVLVPGKAWPADRGHGQRRRTGRDADLRPHAVRPGAAGRIRRPPWTRSNFEKFVQVGSATEVRVKRHERAVGHRARREIVYVRSDGMIVQALGPAHHRQHADLGARPRVVLRLEGGFSKAGRAPPSAASARLAGHGLPGTCRRACGVQP